MVQAATNREHEREAKAQERERRKGASHAQMLATLQGSTMANPESLKDKAQGKCLSVERQDNEPKSVQTMTSVLKQLATNVFSCDTEWHSATGQMSLKVKHQTFPHDGPTRMNQPDPASLPVTDNHQGARAKGAAGCGRSVQLVQSLYHV